MDGQTRPALFASRTITTTTTAAATATTTSIFTATTNKNKNDIGTTTSTIPTPTTITKVNYATTNIAMNIALHKQFVICTYIMTSITSFIT